MTNLQDELKAIHRRLDLHQNESERVHFSLAQQVDKIATRNTIGVYKNDVIEDIIGNHTNQIIGAWFKKNLWLMIGTLATVFISLFAPFGTLMYYKSNLDAASLDIKELKEVRIDHTKELERIKSDLKTEVAMLRSMVEASQTGGIHDKTEILDQIKQINARINNLDLVIRDTGNRRRDP